MYAVLLGMFSVMATTAAVSNVRPECVAAKIALVNRDISFLELRPELFVGSDACGLDHLVEAVYRGDAFAEALLKLDASLVNGTGLETPLHHAIYDDNTTAVAWLADRGAALTRIGLFGFSPLEFAVFRNAVVVMKVLLDRGVDVNVQTVHKRTALMTAILYRRIEPFWLLLPLSNLTLVDDRGDTALLYAVNVGVQHISRDFVRPLLDAGADARVRSGSGYTALMAAVQAHAGQAVLEALVRAGADVEARGPGDETAVTIAAQSCSWTVVDTLVTLGASVPFEVERFCM